MSASEPTSSEQIVIQCPACGAAESADAGMLAGSPTIVCRECGETWPVAPPAPPVRRRKIRKKAKRRRPSTEIIVAEKRALVSYSNSADTAWKAKIEGDYWPEPPRASRWPAVAAAVAALFFLTAFFGGREAAVAALPDLAGLYAAVGLPVNLDRFAIEDVGAERTPAFGGEKLVVRATLRNVGSAPRTLPPLAAVLYSNALVPAGTYGFDPPEKPVSPGDSVSLLMEIESAPAGAGEVTVRFRRRGETLAVAGIAQPAQP